MGKQKVIATKNGGQNDFLNIVELTVANIEKNTERPYYIATRRALSTELTCMTHDYSRCDSVMIIPIIKDPLDNYRIVLIEQYRPAIDGFIYEFPAGLVDEGETPMIAAIRELHEETGLSPIKIGSLTNPTFNSVGMSDETTQIFIAICDGNVTTEFLEGNEELDFRIMELDNIDDFVRKNVFSTKSALCCLLVKEYIKNIDKF